MALPKAFDPHSTVSFLATFSVLSQRFDASGFEWNDGEVERSLVLNR